MRVYNSLVRIIITGVTTAAWVASGMNVSDARAR